MNRDDMRRAYAEAMGLCGNVEPLPALPAVPLARWRDVADALIARAARLLPVAEIWLPSLLNDLDRRFDLPLAVEESGPVRTVTALGFVRYTIDREARAVSSTLLAAPGPIEVEPSRFDVVCVWRRLGWLQPLFDALPAMRLIDTLLPQSHRDGVLANIAKYLAPMIRRDQRFQRLRRDLRAALCFDPSLFGLALRARHRVDLDGIYAKELMEVWQFEAHLRVIEKDAPRLLPIARVVIDWLVDAPASDAVKSLKSLLGEMGATDVGWRYLLKHGHGPITYMGGGDLQVHEVAQMAQALALAGGHPPAPPALYAAFAPRFTRIASHGADHKDSILTWLKNERRLAGAILRAAQEAKRTPQYAQFIDDVASVLWWLRDAKIATPRRSLRKLIEAAKAWEADQLAIAKTGQRRWSAPRTIACPDGLHEAVLLDRPAAVLEEARAMRNCLRMRLPLLKACKVQAWSVRRKESGERVALIELGREAARWELHEVAARFNRPAPPWVWPFAESLAVLETLRVERTQGA